MDDEIVAEIEAAGWIMSEDAFQNEGQATTYTFRHHLDETKRSYDQAGGKQMLEFTRRLRDIGVWKAGKHIPVAYLRASAKQRLALLQGIMDTDGCVVAGQTTCQIALSNRRLMDDVRELVLSLGHKVGAPLHKISNYGTDVWTINFSSPESVFRLTRKVIAQRLVTRPNSKPNWRTIVDVRPVAPVPTQCIAVDSPNHLYLAGREMIPTHNTSLAMEIGINGASRGPVVAFSLEMRHGEVVDRMLSSSGLVAGDSIKTGNLSEDQWDKLALAANDLMGLPFEIDDDPMVTVDQIRSRTRQIKSRYGGLSLVIVDYLQLMQAAKRTENRVREVAEISEGLKRLARELDCPILALAQLNRNLENRVDKRPILSDLKDSGSLEQDADVVLFVYRDEIYDDESPDKGVAEVIVAKHRSGKTGTVRLAFRGQYTRFDNMARTSPRAPAINSAGYDGGIPSGDI